MKYLKIKGYELVEVFGKDIRNMEKIGIKVYQKWQMLDKYNKISYGIIEDQEKFQNANILLPKSVTTFDTKEEVNADIDIEYSHYFIITDIEKLKLDIELSGGISAIEGYNPNKSLDSQENLQALLQRDMAGIGINRKTSYFE